MLYTLNITFKQNKIDIIEIYRYVEYTYLRLNQDAFRAMRITLTLFYYIFFFVC